MPTEKLTLETALAIEADLCSEFGMIVARKEGLIATIIGAGFEIVRAFGAKIPSGEQFNQNFTTTLPLLPIRGLPRGLVLLPASRPGAVLDPTEHVHRFAHEAKHCDQYTNPAPGEVALAWGARYVSDSGFRASQEAGGYLVNVALDWALGLEQRAPKDIAHVVTNNYALDPHDERLVSDLIELDAIACFEGIVRCNVARRTIRRIAELQPGALIDEARLLAGTVVL